VPDKKSAGRLHPILAVRPGPDILKTKETPINMVLALMVTEQCNFHCGHCMVNSSHEYSCVSEEIIERFLHTLRIGHPDEVYLLGGEPLLHIDVVEKLTAQIKPYCRNIMIFTNGTFLLNSHLKQKVDDLGVSIRISDDRFHRAQWSQKLEQAILTSGCLIARKEADEDMIPVGRAYEEFKHLTYHMGCSLLTGRYDESYPNGHRYMVMLNGDVNLYCATIEGALANVLEEKDVTYDLLVEREKILHNYLMQEVIRCEEDMYMAVMCNRCSRYKVTARHILYEGRIVADTDDYRISRS